MVGYLSFPNDESVFVGTLLKRLITRMTLPSKTFNLPLPVIKESFCEENKGFVSYSRNYIKPTPQMCLRRQTYEQG